MKISLEAAEGRNLFTAYGEGYVDVNGTRHRANVVVSADAVEPAWSEGPLEALTEAHMDRLAAARPEIVLLGSGATFRFPPPALLAPLHRAGIGVEVMDTRAACRTYNILLGEGRRVVAALIVE
ncbi:MAG TPA: Mth938-like domain-containing protein [Usitatibacteraceae bacterium]|nr:Mth938-like domain-containing protein [Usitatibacteraceae bacterium]